MFILHDRAFCVGNNDIVARVSLVDFDGQRCLANLPPQNIAIDNAWLQTYCPRVMDGVDRICGYIAKLAACAVE